MTTGYSLVAQRFSRRQCRVIYGLTLALFVSPVCFAAIALAAGPLRGTRPTLTVGWPCCVGVGWYHSLAVFEEPDRG